MKRFSNLAAVGIEAVIDELNRRQILNAADGAGQPWHMTHQPADERAHSIDRAPSSVSVAESARGIPCLRIEAIRRRRTIAEPRRTGLMGLMPVQILPDRAELGVGHWYRACASKTAVVASIARRKVHGFKQLADGAGLMHS